MKISSAATVTTVETLAECKIAIKTLKKFHDVPVYVACDTQGVYDQLGRLEGVIPVIMPFERPNVVTHNNYHRPDAIAVKMPIMRRAMESHPDVLFFDADLVFLADLGNVSSNVDLVLSLNMAVTPDMNLTVGKFGLFNAGLLWTKSLGFIDFWEKEYLSPSVKDAFYEQTALGLAPLKFTTDYFDTMHNWGHWRGFPARRVLSYHVHTSDDLPCSLQYLKARTQSLRRHLWSSIPDDVAVGMREELGHPKKILFAHYGKAAGVYTNHSFKSIKGYSMLDSWTLGLGRDWTSEELVGMLSKGDPWRYIHQHHVNITEDQIRLAKDRGWFIFTFYRDPKEIIAALFSWMNKVTKLTGDNPSFPGEGVMEFDYFFDLMLKNPELWELPKWHHMLDSCMLFSMPNLDQLFFRLFGHSHIPHNNRNTSNNPGWKALLNQGHIEALERMEPYNRSMEWVRGHQ